MKCVCVWVWVGKYVIGYESHVVFRLLKDFLVKKRKQRSVRHGNSLTKYASEIARFSRSSLVMEMM